MSGKRTRRAGKRSYFFSAFLVGVVLCVGAIVLSWQFQRAQTSKGVHAAADPGYFVGPPSLSAAAVDAIFKRVGSSMAGTGSTVERIARQYNIDDAFALGVWWVETNDGMAGVGINDRNPGSVRGSPGYPAAYDGYTIYTSYEQGIADWFSIVKTRYVNIGLTSAYTLCYPYVGTSSAAHWATKVVNLMASYRGEAPPPQPTPAQPTPTPQPPTPTPTIVATARPVASHIQPQPQLRPRGVQAPVGRRQGLVSPAVNSATDAHIPALPIIGFGLLAAAIIAYWGRKIGRDVPAPVITEYLSMPAFAQVPPTPMTAPLAPFSPAFAAATPAFFASELSGGETHIRDWQESFDYAIVPSPTPLPRRVAVTVPARPTRAAGLLTSASYHNTDDLGYRLVPAVVRDDVAEEDTQPRMRAHL